MAADFDYSDVAVAECGTPCLSVHAMREHVGRCRECRRIHLVDSGEAVAICDASHLTDAARLHFLDSIGFMFRRSVFRHSVFGLVSGSGELFIESADAQLIERVKAYADGWLDAYEFCEG